jgi:hypothetical protein
LKGVVPLKIYSFLFQSNAQKKKNNKNDTLAKSGVVDNPEVLAKSGPSGNTKEKEPMDSVLGNVLKTIASVTVKVSTHGM